MDEGRKEGRQDVQKRITMISPSGNPVARSNVSSNNGVVIVQSM